MKIQKLNLPMNEQTTLAYEIAKLRTPSLTTVKKLYGTLGVDIYQNKNNISILKTPKATPNIFCRFFRGIKNFFFPMFEYEKKDTMFDVLLKHFHNEKILSEEDIQTRFGEKGIEEFEKMKAMNFIIKN